jgi:hypothetical protein
MSREPQAQPVNAADVVAVQTFEGESIPAGRGRDSPEFLGRLARRGIGKINNGRLRLHARLE